MYAYKEFNKMYRYVIRIAKATYYDEKFKEYSKNIKQTGSILNELLNVKKLSKKYLIFLLITGKFIPALRSLQKALMTFFLALEASWLTKFLHLKMILNLTKEFR